MKGKGVIVLVVILTLFFSVIILNDYDNMPLATIYASAVPTQVTNPTIAMPDQKIVCIIFDDGQAYLWEN